VKAAKIEQDIPTNCEVQAPDIARIDLSNLFSALHQAQIGAMTSMLIFTNKFFQPARRGCFEKRPGGTTHESNLRIHKGFQKGGKPATILSITHNSALTPGRY